MTTATRVLVVDDEPYLADLVATALRYEGFACGTAATGRDALRHVADFHPHLIVLDIMLPDGSGIDTCRRLRENGNRTPIVFLTAKDTTQDKVTGLTAGGDDYVTKPFSLDELIARVRAVLRRTTESDTTSVLTFADLEIDDDAHQVRKAGRLIDVSPTEFKLLRYLVVNAGKVLSRRQILEHVWQYDFGGNDTIVATYISYLRRKLDDATLIHTVPRVGYVIRQNLEQY